MNTSVTARRNLCSVSFIFWKLVYSNIGKLIKHHFCSLTLTVMAKNGGYRQMNNTGSSGSYLTKDYFIGQTSVKSTMFRFDFVKPYHCLLDKPPCSTKALDATKDITKVPKIQPSIVYQVIYASCFVRKFSPEIVH